MLVIKPGHGYGGENVFIGKNTSKQKWTEMINKALLGKNWFVQEAIEYQPYLYQASENGCFKHDSVWGFFAFGSRAGGGWLRVLPQKDNRGIVNCHQGATVSAIFEVAE